MRRYHGIFYSGAIGMRKIWSELIGKIAVPRVITIIGGGGKTSLMYYLVTVLKAAGYPAIAATTTKLSNQSLSGNHFVEISSVEAGYHAVQQAKAMQGHVTLVSGEDKDRGKMLGISQEWIDQLAVMCKDSVLVVEADGSAGKSLKGHLAHEPVIPRSSSLVIPVIGIDCVGMKLDIQCVHRPERICELTGASYASVVTTEMITELLFHSQGYLHHCLSHHRIVPFINKVESKTQQQQGKELAMKILGSKHSQLAGVLIGSVRQEEGLWLQA